MIYERNRYRTCWDLVCGGYSPPPSIQVIRMQIDVNLGVAGSIEVIAAWLTDRGRFRTTLVFMQWTTIAAPQWEVTGFLLGIQCLLGHFSCYIFLSIIKGRVTGTGLCEHSHWIIFSKALTLLEWYNVHIPWALGFMLGGVVVYLSPHWWNSLLLTNAWAVHSLVWCCDLDICFGLTLQDHETRHTWPCLEFIPSMDGCVVLLWHATQINLSSYSKYHTGTWK